MASRKPRSHVDRLPVDYDKPRTPRTLNPSADFHQDTLVWTPPTAEEVAAAHRYIEAHAPDLLAVLGLAEPTQRAKPLDVACPSCGAGPRRRCVSPQGNGIGHPHAARRRATASTEGDTA